MAVCIDLLVVNFDPHSDCDDGMCVYGIDLSGPCTSWDETLGICMEDPAC